MNFANEKDPFANLGNDDLEATINAPLRTTPVALPASYTPKAIGELCPKCRGTGRFGSFGQCFKCKGKGKLFFATSFEQRSRARTQSAARKASKAEQALEAFKAEHPAIWAWMDGSTFPFAVSLLEGLKKYGSLTEGQLNAARNAIAKRDAAIAARKLEAEQAAANAPAVDTAGVDRLKESFAKAIAYTAEKKVAGLRLRNPRITIGSLSISPAKAESKNPGALYVKAGSEYLGKIVDGKFFGVRECTDEQRAQVVAFIANPAEAAKAYGQETGVCCVCNAALTSKWRLRGIGPVCAEKMGWAGE